MSLSNLAFIRAPAAYLTNPYEEPCSFRIIVWNCTSLAGPVNHGENSADDCY